MHQRVIDNQREQGTLLGKLTTKDTADVNHSPKTGIEIHSHKTGIDTSNQIGKGETITINITMGNRKDTRGPTTTKTT